MNYSVPLIVILNCEFMVMRFISYQSYDTKFLKIYRELKPTPLQLEEDLEQLKVLENGYKMKVCCKTLIPCFFCMLIVILAY